jgi:hypothetical protein
VDRFLSLCLSLGFLALASCSRVAPDSAKKEARPESKAVPAPLPKPRAEASPAALNPAIGQVYPEHGHEHPVAPTPPNVKSVGRLGELLEGDVYFFRLVELHRCEGPGSITGSGPTSRVAVGAKVEITAKSALNIQPRDVLLTTGGITFYGGVDMKRELEGCTPLAKISTLRKDEVARGYVLFDIPVTGPGSELDKLGLGYHPTRFGGSGPVFVPAEGRKK